MLNKNLPSSLPLETVITELGYGSYSKETAYRMLFSHAADERIKIRFTVQQEIHCQQEKDGVEPVYEYGEIVKVLSCGATILINSIDMEQDVYLKSCTTTGDCSYLLIHSIVSGNDPYLIVDEIGSFIEPLLLPIHSFYVNTSDLTDILLDANTNPSTTTIKPQLLIQERRVAVLEKWLLSQANNQNTKGPDFQLIYQLIGSPSKPAIWDELSSIDSELFMPESYDTAKRFFADWGKVRWKYGSGSNRNILK